MNLKTHYQDYPEKVRFKALLISELTDTSPTKGSGIHTGIFMNIPSTNKKVEMNVIDIVRIEKGK